MMGPNQRRTPGPVLVDTAIRALDSVIGDQGAIKGILVTTSSFGPESYRIARDKPLDLVDGQQLREWLREYLGIDARRRVLT